MRLPAPSGRRDRVAISLYLRFRKGVEMLLTGIDWSDQALDYHLRTADGRVLADGQVAVSPEGLAELSSTKGCAP